MINVTIEDFRDSDTPYQHAVEHILFGNPNRRLINFDVWWGPEAESLTTEERYKAIYDMLTTPGEVIENVDEHISSITEINVEAYVEGATGFHTGGKNFYDPGTIEYQSFEQGRKDVFAKFAKDGV